MEVELIREDEAAVAQEKMEKSCDSEENQLKVNQVQELEKNMQEEGFSCLSTCLTNDFIGFEDDQEYSKISEKFKNLKNLIESLNERSSENGSDIDISTNDGYYKSVIIGKNFNLISNDIPQDDNNNAEECSPAKKIRCKSINDLLEKSNKNRNHVLGVIKTAANLSPNVSENKNSQVIYKSCNNKSVPKNDKILVIKTGKSVITPSDAINIPTTIDNLKIGNSIPPSTISSRKITQGNSIFNRPTMIPKLLNSETQVPNFPISSSVYSNHSMSGIYPSPYMFNNMPSCSNYMQQGMSPSIGMNSFPFPTPQRFQPPSSFVFDNFNSPITLSQFPNVYSYIRNRRPVVTNAIPRYSYERSQNLPCSSIPTAPTETAVACTYCTFTFVNKKIFNEHLHAGLCSGLSTKSGTNDKATTSGNYHDKEKENVTKQVVYACHICEKSFDEKDELYSHEMVQHNLLSPNEISLKKKDSLHSKRFTCTICHKHFILSKDLFLHLKECHNITNIKDCIPDQSFSLQNKNSHNEEGTPVFSVNDCTIDKSSMNNANALSGYPEFATCVSSETFKDQTNCSRDVDNTSDKPKASTSTSNSLSTISTSSSINTTNSSSRQILKYKSKGSPALTNSSTATSTTSSLSRMSITSNANDVSPHEMSQVTNKDKTASHAANSESNPGKGINCPGCSFTFMGDNLFSQHLKAGLCSKLLTDTISKKFPGYTVCNIKKKDQNKPTEEQNASLKKNNDKYHKIYMCELCSAKFTTKEMLLTHRKSAHKVSNLHPVPTMLTQKSFQNQIDGEVINDRILNQTNPPSTQTSALTSEVLSAAQSEILQNVDSINTKPISTDKQMNGPDNSNTRKQIKSYLESNMNNSVSNPKSSVESPQDKSKNSESCKSHELELEVKRMELLAWKSWKEACDLQVQFWRKKIASPVENNSSGKSSEIEHANASNTFMELNNVNIKQEDENPH